MNFNDSYFEKSVGKNLDFGTRDLPEFVFSGRSNVGKSSLINRILSKKAIARVSSTPGKTITVNYYRCGGVRFVDLPGYGYAKMTDRERENFSVVTEEYFKNSEPIKCCFQLVDMRRPATQDDVMMLQFLRHYNIPYAIILTKCDKLNKTEFETRLSGFKEELGILGQVPLIPFSALKNIGTEDVRKIIEQAI